MLTGCVSDIALQNNPVCNGYYLSLTGFHKHLLVWIFSKTYFNLNSFIMFKNCLALQLIKECVLTK